VEKEEGIARFLAIPEPIVGVIQEPYPEIKHDHRPAPAIDTVQGPGDVKPGCAG